MIILVVESDAIDEGELFSTVHGTKRKSTQQTVKSKKIKMSGMVPLQRARATYILFGEDFHLAPE